MAQGFFNLGPPPKLPSAPKRAGGVSLGCDNCPMGTVKVTWGDKDYQGKGSAKVLIIGSMPESDDLEEGSFFRGARGENLEKELKRIGCNLRQDTWMTLAIACRKQGQSEKELKTAATNCAGRVPRIITELKPNVIICLGPEAIHAVTGSRTTGRLSGVKPSSYVGTVIPDRDLGAWVIPTQSLELLEWSERDPVPLMQFRAQIKTAWALRDKPLPELIEVTQWTQDPKQAIQWIEQAIASGQMIAFDYETSGIKPHREGHHIATASIAWERNGQDFGCAFPWFPKNQEFIAAWAKMLQEAPLCAHKLDFEAAWSAFRSGLNNGPGVWPQTWRWDTCLGAHCLANERPTSLKFNAYTQLGILGFDDDVDEYITKVRPGEDSENKNSLNRVDECHPTIILPYNAKDSLYTLFLARLQMAEMDDMQRVGMEFFLAAAPEMAEVQSAGMNISREALQTRWDDIDSKMQAINAEIQALPEVKRRMSGEPFNPASGPQLKAILGCDKVDEEVLSKLSSPLAKKVLELRKWQKMQGTYLAQFKREEVGGVVRPFFNLHLVATFRSSSDSPNFQNIPKRDKEAQKIVRSLIVPSPGNRIIEYDYKAVEVAVGACYHRDPKMISYIEDPKNDMHRDAACDLFFRKPADFKLPELSGLLKGERQGAKGGLVFPAFYGSTYDQMAPAMWEDMHPETKLHVQKQGIQTLYPADWGDMNRRDRDAYIRRTQQKADTWIAHVSNVERILWDERFKVYKEWKGKIWEQYKRDGFVELYTGFRCYGPLKRTAATNYPIQGSAFHVLLWTMMNVAPRIRRATGNRSRIIGQIHDALVCDVNPADEQLLDNLVQDWGTQRVRKHWPWLIVPLTIEKERSEVDGSWAKMGGCELGAP